VQMEFGQRRRTTADRRSQQLLPKRRVVLPTRPQLMTMTCRDALDFSRAERGDNADHTGRQSQHLGGNARVQARRVPSQGQRLGTQLARRFSSKDIQIRTPFIRRSGTIPNLTPPLLIFESHVDEKKWTLGRPAPRRLIHLEPKLMTDRHDLKRLGLGKYSAPLRNPHTEHLKAALVQCIDEVKRLSAGPFPCWQGSRGIRCIGGHAVIVRGNAPDLLPSLGVFFSKTKSSQRMNAPWKIGSDES
jgi:hypothetical protein